LTKRGVLGKPGEWNSASFSGHITKTKKKKKKKKKKQKKKKKKKQNRGAWGTNGAQGGLGFKNGSLGDYGGPLGLRGGGLPHDFSFADGRLSIGQHWTKKGLNDGGGWGTRSTGSSGTPAALGVVPSTTK